MTNLIQCGIKVIRMDLTKQEKILQNSLDQMEARMDNLETDIQILNLNVTRVLKMMLEIQQNQKAEEEDAYFPEGYPYK